MKYLLALFLFACTPMPQPVVTTTTSTTTTIAQVSGDCDIPYFKKLYYDEAERLTGIKVLRKEFEVRVVEEIDKLGIQSCITKEGSVACAIPQQNLILIERDYWGVRNCQRRKVIFMHEAGHLLGGLSHESPTSIMQQNMMTTEEWNRNPDGHMRKMFKRIYPMAFGGL